MTALADLKSQIADWTNRDFSDDRLEEFVRMGEEFLSSKLRIRDMVQVDEATLIEGRTRLPDDFRSPDMFRPLPWGKPWSFMPRENFYDYSSESGPKGYFTMTGNYLMVGGVDVVSGTRVELTYFGDVPPTGDDPTWLNKRYPSLILNASMIYARAFGEEYEMSALMQSSAEARVQELNDEYLESLTGNLRIKRRKLKGFG